MITIWKQIFEEIEDAIEESVKYRYVIKNGKKTKRAYTDKKGY